MVLQLPPTHISTLPAEGTDPPTNWRVPLTQWVVPVVLAGVRWMNIDDHCISVHITVTLAHNSNIPEVTSTFLVSKRGVVAVLKSALISNTKESWCVQIYTS